MLTAPSTRLPSLTGMRWIAALLVFVTHVAGSKIFHDEGLSEFLSARISQTGYVGVSFFFILSGFVLTWTARPDDTTRRFWRRRAAKIFPNHLVTWAVGVVALIAAGTVTLGTTLPALFLVHAWVPDERVAFLPNDPSWSLCAEVLFYLAFPLLLRLANRIRPERLWAWVGILVAVLALIPVVAQALPEQPHISYYDISWYQYWFVYTFPVSRVPEFVLGIVMARIVMTGRWVPIGMPAAMALVVPGYLVMITLPDVYGLVAPTALPLALVVAAGATADIEGRRSLFRGRVMVWLGEVSFAFYLIHMLVLQLGPVSAGSGRTFGLAEGLALVAFSAGAALVLAWLLYRFVEKPAMRRFARPAAERRARGGPGHGSGPDSGTPPERPTVTTAP